MTDVVLLLRMDERAGSVYFTDYSGQGNHAACALLPTCPLAGEAGRIDQALQFAGESLTVADTPSLNFDEGQSFSIQTWVMPTQGDSIVLRKGSAQPGYQLGLASSGAASLIGVSGGGESAEYTGK